MTLYKKGEERTVVLCMIKRISEVILHLGPLPFYSGKNHRRRLNSSDNSLDLSASLNNKSNLFVFSNLTDCFDWIDCSGAWLWYHVDVTLSKSYPSAVSFPTQLS